MKIAYLDCMSGISGDMTLGALVDAGVDLGAIQAGIDSLGLPDCRLVATEAKKKGFRATKITVEHEPEHAHRHLHHITEMIDASDVLTHSQKELAKRIFTRLGEAEALVHGTTIRKVHFHEVGAVDSIADIVGSAIGWDLLGVDRIECSPIPTGYGFVKIAHGRVSIPAPATAELLKGIPIAPSEVECELTTPTGAAIVSTIVDQFGYLPPMQIDTIGYGAGDKDLDTQGNILRLLVGEASEASVADQIWVLETNLDDTSGEIIGHCAELLGEAGALDVYSSSIQMKKNRPGVKLTILCYAADVKRLEKILFKQTSTIGIRKWLASRHVLPREARNVETQWGTLEGKLATLPDGEKRFSPEYESCRRISEANEVSVQTVYQEAMSAYLNSEGNKA
ncbi:MAG: nickel pincer cofactor biosynthesis protein LarC [Planctomycetota bacterium]|nr:nickel pincer cofactor biosynthesis protein LarC [Planctomycetota bacterium]